MKFVIGTISASGEKTVTHSPQIIATENQKAQISAANAQGKEEIFLSVVAARKKI